MTPPLQLLDTNVIIHVRKGLASVVDRFERLEPGEAAISVISYGELIYGAEKSEYRDHNLAVLAELLSFLDVLPLPRDVGDSYGAIRADLERRGEQIGHNDLWIAAHAKAAGLVLVTANEREFVRVGDLTVENWAR